MDSPDIHIVTNVGDKILSSKQGSSNLHGFLCTHMEEADCRLILHTKDMVSYNAERVVIQSNDTDVVVLAVSFFFELKWKVLRELYTLFRFGNHRRYISVHSTAESLEA